MTVAYTVLIVEDQPDISGIVSKYLQNEGYNTRVAPDGLTALEIFGKEHVHLVVLDVLMPGIDGFDVLREIRKVADTPVIFVTARTEESDRLKGFDIGADDYVVKPFSVRELARRVSALLKRTYQSADERILKAGDLTLRTGSMKLFRGDAEIPVTAAEFALLLALFRHRGQVLSREKLIELAYGDAYEGFDRNIDSAIKRLRQKIELDPKNPALLLTKYGAGYVLGGEGL